MAGGLKEREQQGFYDPAFNPAQQAHDDRVDASLRNKEASGTLGDRENTASNAVDNSLNTTSSLSEKENSSGLYEPSNTVGAKKQPASAKDIASKLLRRKGIIGAGVALIGGGGIMASFFSLALGPIHFIESVFPDINDWLSPSTAAERSITRHKLIKGAKHGAVKGCSKLSIRCKFKTFSKTEITRMERAGIKVKGEKNIIGRTVASEVEFHGQTFTAEEWANELKTNRLARQAQLRANNMSFRGLSSRGPFGKVMNRFGITKKAPGLKGSKQDRLNQLLTAANTNDPGKVKFVDVVDDSGQPTGKSVIDDGTLTLEDGTVKESSLKEGMPTYSEKDKAKAQKNLGSATAKSTPPSKTKRAALGAASILGYADLACSVKNMVVAAGVAAKINNQMNLIKNLQGVISLTGKFKAGEASPEDAEALGQFFMETDSRKTIDSIDPESVTHEGQAAKVTQVNNPNYKKNAMDSSLLAMSVNGGYAKQNETTARYALGASQNALISATGLSNFMSSVDTITNGGEICSFVQHPVTRIIGTIIAVGAGAATGGGSLGWQAAITAAMMVSMAILESWLNSALTGDVLTGMAEDPVGRGEAVWTAMAGMGSATSQAYGMAPATVNDLRASHYETTQIKQEYIALEKEDAKNNPFDVTNRFSFLGVIGRNLGYKKGSLLAPAMVLGNSLRILNPANRAYASSFNERRFQQCDDEEYKKFKDSEGLAVDVQCNVRYFTPSEDLQKIQDPDAVVDYMENNGYIPKDSEDGLPGGYTPPNMRQAWGTISNTLYGATLGGFFDQRALMLTNDYAKYLEACVYRTAPLGETGEESGLIGGLGDWQDGSRCAERSEMVSYFRAFTLLSGVGDTVDEEEGTETNSVATTLSKNGEGIVKAGEMFFDYKYYYGGPAFHSSVDIMKDTIEKVKNGSLPKGTILTDCSGFVRASIYAATGLDIEASSTGVYSNYVGKTLDEVSQNDLKPGDIAWKAGHVEIVTSVDGGVVYTQGARGPEDGGPIGGPAVLGGWTKFYRAKV